MATVDEIRARFEHHPPNTPERIHAHENVRMQSAELAVMFERRLPESREKSLALTALQEAAMWANAAIAIHEGDLP